MSSTPQCCDRKSPRWSPQCQQLPVTREPEEILNIIKSMWLFPLNVCLHTHLILGKEGLKSSACCFGAEKLDISLLPSLLYFDTFLLPSPHQEQGQGSALEPQNCRPLTVTGVPRKAAHTRCTYAPACSPASISQWGNSQPLNSSLCLYPGIQKQQKNLHLLVD